MIKLDRTNVAIATILMAQLGIAANYFSLPLFFGVDFIFGSVTVMLAAALLGTLPAVVVAVAAGAFTIYLWGHPYAMIIFTLEGLVVALLHRRYGQNLVLADLAFWFGLGVPLGFVFYHNVIGLPLAATSLIIVKQPINGLFNALIAGIVVLCLQLSPRFAHSGYWGLASLNNLVFYTLLSAIVVAGTVPILFESYKSRTQLESFVAERLNLQAETVIREIERHDVLEGGAWKNHLGLPDSGENTGISLLDRNGNVIDTHGMVSPGDVNLARVETVPGGRLQIVLPDEKLPAMKRWKAGRYRLTVSVPNGELVAAVVVEEPAISTIVRLQADQRASFYAIAVLMLLGVLVSRFLSVWITRPLRQLHSIGSAIKERVSGGAPLRLQRSAIHEYADLGETFESLSDNLAALFRELHVRKVELEQEVEKRTAEVRRLSRVASEATDGVIITGRDGRIEWVNDAFVRVTGFQLDWVKGRKPGEFLQGEETDPETVAAMSAALAKGQGFDVDVLNYTKARTPFWVNIICNPVLEEDGSISGFTAIQRDITDRKSLEAQLRSGKDQGKNPD